VPVTGYALVWAARSESSDPTPAEARLMSLAARPGRGGLAARQEHSRRLEALNNRALGAHFSLYDRTAPSDGLAYLDSVHMAWWLFSGRRAWGPVFALFSQYQQDEAVMLNYLAVVARRQQPFAGQGGLGGVGVEAYVCSEATSDQQVARLCGELCTLYTSWGNYLLDQGWVRGQGPGEPLRKDGIDTFSSYEDTSSGDCEDSAKLIMKLWWTLCRQGWQSRAMLRLQTVARRYVCVLALCGVRGPAMDTGGGGAAEVGGGKDFAAHLCALALPCAQMLRLCSKEHAGALSKELERSGLELDHQERMPPLVLEGTALFQCTGEPAGYGDVHRARVVCSARGSGLSELPDLRYAGWRGAGGVADSEDPFYHAVQALILPEGGAYVEFAALHRQPGGHHTYGVPFWRLVDGDAAVELRPTVLLEPGDREVYEYESAYAGPQQPLGTANLFPQGDSGAAQRLMAQLEEELWRGGGPNAAWFYLQENDVGERLADGLRRCFARDEQLRGLRAERVELSPGFVGYTLWVFTD